DRQPEGQPVVSRGAEKDGPVNERALRPDVGEFAERARERADDEAGLDRDRERRAPAIVERPLALERGQDRGGTEPEGEGAELGERENGQLPPGARHPGGATR